MRGGVDEYGLERSGLKEGEVGQRRERERWIGRVMEVERKVREKGKEDRVREERESKVWEVRVGGRGGRKGEEKERETNGDERGGEKGEREARESERVGRRGGNQRR